MHHFALVLLACIVEALCGYPRWLFARIRHPVVWMGAGIALLERNCNRPDIPAATRRALGMRSLAALLAVTFAAAWLLRQIHPIVEILAIATLLAGRSLYDHVRDLASATSLEDAREKLARIVGRDVAALDEAGVNRAAIESLAESFCDGVVAPIFWAACFGLPGIACYKAINTADSMIGHKDARYRAYGWSAARLDDAANFIPARLSGLLIILASRSANAWHMMLRDARKHASPNAGWPEAAMAGALHLQLAGPQLYDGKMSKSAFIGDGTREATAAHLEQALRIYMIACGLVWLMLLAPAMFL